MLNKRQRSVIGKNRFSPPEDIDAGSITKETPSAAAPITEQAAKVSFPALNLASEIRPPPTVTLQVRAAMHIIARFMAGNTTPDFENAIASGSWYPKTGDRHITDAHTNKTNIIIHLIIKLVNWVERFFSTDSACEGFS